MGSATSGGSFTQKSSTTARSVGGTRAGGAPVQSRGKYFPLFIWRKSVRRCNSSKPFYCADPCPAETLKIVFVWDAHCTVTHFVQYKSDEITVPSAREALQGRV